MFATSWEPIVELDDRVRLLELANAFNELAAKLGPAETRGGGDSQAESPV